MNIIRPFDLFREIFRESNQRDRELFRYVFEKSDSISLWIIGLSIGGISIFANNIADIKNTVDSTTLKTILWLLAISVTFGILYRSLYLYFFVIQNYVQRGIEVAFMDKRVMDTESRLTGKESFDELIEILYEGFGEDFPILKNLYPTLDEKQQEELYKRVVEYYQNNVKFAKDDIKMSLEFIADTYSKFTGVKKDKYLKKFNNPGNGSNYRWLLRITTIVYLIYVSTFFAALFVFAFNA